MNLVEAVTRVSRLIVDMTFLSFQVTLSLLTAGVRCVIPPSRKSLLGETVLVTGAGHGIGRELAIKLAEMGCIVVCWDIDKDRNLNTKNAIIEAGGEAYDFVVDVSNRIEVREAARLMRKYRVPNVTILINNAAVLMQKSFADRDVDDVERTFGVNVFSQFWTIETFLPIMLQNKKGHIVAISSLCGVYGVSQKITYCASKFAIRGLMKGLREEYKAQQFIHFTTIYPFYVATGLAQDPKYRFSWIFGAISPEYAAGEIVRAVQRNYNEYIIPKWLCPLNSILGSLPQSSVDLIINFLSRKKC
ncbi:short-chain dehydrogenase/reductase family 16C member 6 [Fopius arisanus]|uniref:Short-chain dehydrogenase/reductase 3 n=2 Tax=Fopius arisanus TaxID=64838 RepID=A0A9R1T7B4_9HYME|nr:PREDICTED: short-chain dehydrogenase/reductase family 16C member 6-like [Fopius arisanus]